MTEAGRKKFVYALFGLSVIFGLYYFTSRDNGGQNSDQPDPAIPSSARVAGAALQMINLEQYAALRWGRDPFQGRKPDNPEEEPAERPSWTLNGILYSDTSPAAVINHVIVSTGDKINGAEVVAIYRDRVILDWNGQSQTLQLSGGKS